MLKEKTKQEVPEYHCGYLHDKKIKRMKAYVQHGDISTYDHCLLVAYYSFILARKLHLKCSERELIRGALLHDYYLYDWHEKEKWHRWHGFRHANFALKNAMRDFELSVREIEIIQKHMWPLTIIPPTCREAWIVNGADTFISLIETIASRRKSRKMKEQWILQPLAMLHDHYAKTIGVETK